jgi:predicted nucleic-acid-binding Zn-ribbon protein
MRPLTCDGCGYTEDYRVPGVPRTWGEIKVVMKNHACMGTVTTKFDLCPKCAPCIDQLRDRLVLAPLINEIVKNHL